MEKAVVIQYILYRYSARVKVLGKSCTETAQNCFLFVYLLLTPTSGIWTLGESQTGPLNRELTFLLTKKLAATARPCVKLSIVLAKRLRYPLIYSGRGKKEK